MPVATASSSSGKTQRRGTPGRKARTGFQSLYGRWKKCIFATIPGRDAHERRHARAVRDEFQQKWKRPFRKKVTVLISKQKSDLQSLKFLMTKRNARWSSCVVPHFCVRSEEKPRRAI